MFTSVVGKPFDGGGTNQLGHRELPKPGMGAWGPSPDLLYSKCLYDVSAGPVRVTHAGARRLLVDVGLRRRTPTSSRS